MRLNKSRAHSVCFRVFSESVSKSVHAGQSKMKSVFAKRSVATLITLLLMFASFVAGNFTGFWVQPVLAQHATPPEFGVFWETWDLVVQYFVDRDKVNFT